MSFLFLSQKKSSVKERNKTQPVLLVPWKSISEQNKQDDLKVPLRATIISTASMIFVILASVTYPLLFASNDFVYDRWVFAGIVMLGGSLNLPLLLVFTIKHKKEGTTRRLNQPPQNLQFHDEALDMAGYSHPLQFHKDFDSDIGSVYVLYPSHLSILFIHE